MQGMVNEASHKNSIEQQLEAQNAMTEDMRAKFDEMGQTLQN
jgi:hypothetical protein